MPSDENIVRHNVFVGERVGVWLASRQSKDLSKWDCGDPPLTEQEFIIRTSLIPTVYNRTLSAEQLFLCGMRGTIMFLLIINLIRRLKQ